MDSSLLRKGLAGCLTVLALGTPVALADPPVNDNYLSSLRLNDPGSRLDRSNTLVDRRDTAQATTQADIFAPPRSGGPAEPAACKGTGYGHTAWYDFYPDESGVVRVRASGYDAVVSVFPFSRQTLVPDFAAGQCSNAEGAAATEELLMTVSGGKAYTVQVGGVADVAGPLTFQFDYLADADSDGVLDNVDDCPTLAARGRKKGCPPSVGAQATLRAQPTAGGVTLLGLAVSAASGTRVRVRCTRGCASQSSRGPRASFPRLKGAQLPAGATLAIFVTKPGAIGSYVSYRIARGNFTKSTRCLNPGSTTPRKRCR
jgi:hypothetical protein